MKRKTVIYGAGEYGQQIYHFLSDLGVHINCFCQTYAESGAKVLGLSVVSFIDLIDTKDNIVFFLAITDKDVCGQIKPHIQSVFLDRAVIIDGSSIMEYVSVGKKDGGYCNLCNSNIKEFLPGGLAGIEKVGLFKEHHIIGGGFRKHYSCPVCGGVDRERWLVWVLSQHTDIFSTGCSVLHFAPEKPLTKYLLANPECDYYSGDIVLGRAMHKTDIMNIQYKDSFFDYVIMNHVLEHIENMEMAMSEVKRVMKKDGKLILSFPICTDQDTLELPNIATDEERLVHYGQEDHVRLFGRDYLQIIKDFGFSVSVHTPKDYFSLEDIEHYGFTEDDILMICSPT